MEWRTEGDNGTNAWQVEAAVAKVPVLRLDIVHRGDGIKCSTVPSRRWVVERTFSWFGRDRRLAKDYENQALTLAAIVTLAPSDGSRDSRLLSQALSLLSISY